MPFAVSHAAAVLRFSRFLARRRLLSAALTPTWRGAHLLQDASSLR
jgi:hypothetical protein